MAASTDARLGLVAALGAPTAFLVLAGLPYAVGDFAPPLGLDALWGPAGMLVIVLAPVVAGMAGFASVCSLWQRRDASIADRRVHVLTLLAVAAFAALYLSGWGGDVVEWWLD